MDSVPRTSSVPQIRSIGFSELPDELRDLLEPRVERLGYLGEFFQVAAHQPKALAGFIQMTEALKDALPADLTEVVALSAATSLGNDYERCQHEQLSVRLGFDAAWVKEVETLDPGGGTLLTETQQAAQRLCLALLSSWGRDATTELTDVLAATDQEVAVGILLLTGRYAAHALVANVMQIPSPVPSIFPEDAAATAGAGHD